MITIQIETNNAAFDEGENIETARILRGLADAIEYNPDNFIALRDINGNTVGNYRECEEI